MKQLVNMPDNPVFETVTGLTNTTFDPESSVPNRGATEGQLAAIHAHLAEVHAQIDEIEGAENGVLLAIWDRLETLTTQIEECCTVDHGEGALDNLWAKIQELTTQIEECCNRNVFGGGEATGTPGDNEITVTFEWNGANQVTAGGKATATCSNSERSIAGYYFLVRDVNAGIYYRSSTANGGAFVWRIDSSGNVTASSGSQAPFSFAIVAVDDQGNEGSVSVNLPQVQNVVGG